MHTNEVRRLFPLFGSLMKHFSNFEEEKLPGKFINRIFFNNLILNFHAGWKNKTCKMGIWDEPQVAKL